MFDFSLIGLTGRDKRVYEALLSEGDFSLRAIALSTDINRGSVYESIKALQKAGLVSHTNYGKRQRYVAASPDILYELIDEKRRDLARSHVAVSEYISSLPDPKQFETLPFATSYEDNEGLASILRDVIVTMKSSEDKLYRVVSSPDLQEYLYHNFKNYTRERIKNKILVNVISHEDGPNSKSDLAERRMLSVGHAKAPRCYTIIYGSKVAFIALNPMNIPYGVVIDNDSIAQLQVTLFDQLWANLKS
jgi:sugar-specific transcriptional regulator TrmB